MASPGRWGIFPGDGFSSQECMLEGMTCAYIHMQKQDMHARMPICKRTYRHVHIRMSAAYA